MLTCLLLLAVLRYCGVDARALRSGRLASVVGNASRRLLLLALGFFVMPSSAIPAQIAAPPAHAPTTGTLIEEMDRLGVETALLVPSQAVDARPTWSPEGDRLAANVDGTWYSVSMNEVALEAAAWRGRFGGCGLARWLSFRRAAVAGVGAGRARGNALGR